ncbi:hypothetical protein [Arcticibacter eurypsychrophilus]|uniref:hypothetical protein n=1 Tax=Arcticibacter eurypsychrophilus TaxID=1434752 RepID=UPI00147C10A8|nr:hypothetical protein [Arcticibacter eurypsychrophilus]
MILWWVMAGIGHIRKKVKAACIDRGRDIHQIMEADFTLYYKYRISNGSAGHMKASL